MAYDTKARTGNDEKEPQPQLLQSTKLRSLPALGDASLFSAGDKGM